MARSYHVDIARHAADADAKWLDNLLSHFSLPGVEGGTPGEARRITTDGIYRIVLVRRLATELGLSVAESVRMAARILAAPASAITVASALELRLDLARFGREVDIAIADAVESVTPPRRGRPPLKAKR
jgi:hypothetical protein